MRRRQGTGATQYDEHAIASTRTVHEGTSIDIRERARSPGRVETLIPNLEEADGWMDIDGRREGTKVA